MAARRLSPDEADLAASVWDAYRPFVESVARTTLRDQPDLVPDVVQDVGVRICQGLDSFRWSGGIRTWLFRVTLNEALKAIHTENRQGQVNSLAPVPTSNPLSRPDLALEHAERMAAIRTALGRLSDNQRNMLRHDLDAAPIYRSDKVRALRYRARKELRNLLNRT